MGTSLDKPFLGVWSVDTVYELLNDMICFEFIRSIMDHMENREAKAYVTSFLKLIAPTFVHELITALDKLAIAPKTEQGPLEVRRFINQERQRALKDVITRSPRAEAAMKEMGLDFSREVYDINVVIHGGTLMDTNFELFTDPVENTALWNRMFTTPKALLSVFSKALSEHNSALDLDEIWHTIECKLPEFAKRIDYQLCCERYSYSSYRLFGSAPELTLQDKIFILYRFRLVTAALIIPQKIPSLVFDIGGSRVVDTERFFRKYKALVIEILGAQFKESRSAFIDRIQQGLAREIDNKQFFKLNRAIRNNMHYETTHILTEEEIALVDRYQSVYLNEIVKHFNSSLTVTIDKRCQLVTAYFKACMDKGMTKKEIDQHSYLRYLVYAITGRLVK